MYQYRNLLNKMIPFVTTERFNVSKVVYNILSSNVRKTEKVGSYIVKSYLIKNIF